ncbi:hypothetical protein NUW54_g11813 [Trametes sanguinea]|uniref:Uncharacterized protein n=1 Tax=Trametes sanguinea TaxID=158606 RepID=A0ACC1N6L7_9APHY|nr:hypothetical protein NUW54_g11813 [Trametes sanguinea]
MPVIQDAAVLWRLCPSAPQTQLKPPTICTSPCRSLSPLRTSNRSCITVSPPPLPHTAVLQKLSARIERMPRASKLGDALGVGYATRIGRERGTLRTVITDGLVEITGDPRGKMHWTVEGFCRFVFLVYGVKLLGWPPHIRFANLSDPSIPTRHIRQLLDAWEHRRMRWARATVGEITAAREDPRNACPGCRFPDPRLRGGRNDIGKHRERPTIDSTRFPARYARDGPKSRRYIDSDE